MRTNIMIDEKLISVAIKVTGARTKKEAVALGLRSLIQLKKQESPRGLRGKLKWRDDLDRMRIAIARDTGRFRCPGRLL